MMLSDGLKDARYFKFEELAHFFELVGDLGTVDKTVEFSTKHFYAEIDSIPRTSGGLVRRVVPW